MSVTSTSKGVNALVLGYGRSGKAAEALLCRSGFTVTVLDGEAKFPEGDFMVAVVSPGIALTHSWIVEAKRRGIPLKSELQFGCEELKRQGWKLLAVTGSKGKSSVVKVVADAINLAGMHAVACGNYGLPVSAVALESGSGRDPAPPASITGGAESFPLRRYAVVEVSSFMMETTELPADTFEAATILNLQEDHLDRHGSVETYHGLKRKLLTMAVEKFDMSAFDGHRLRESACQDGPDEEYWSSYFDNEILARNALAAWYLMVSVKPVLDAKVRTRAFREFVPLPHRMNRIATIDEVEYIDDSKATSLAALEAGVRMSWSGPSEFRKLVAKLGFPWRRRVLLIAGGLPKGDDPKSVVSILTERVKKVYLIGQSAEVFASAWKSCVDCEVCGTMDVAVAAAKREAVKGEKVLLSPGTASFDQFKSFGERGDVFARLVKKENR